MQLGLVVGFQVSIVTDLNLDSANKKTKKLHKNVIMVRVNYVFGHFWSLSISGFCNFGPDNVFTCKLCPYFEIS